MCLGDGLASETRPEKLLAFFSPQKRLSGLSPADLLKAVNALSQEVGSEEKES